MNKHVEIQGNLVIAFPSFLWYNFPNTKIQRKAKYGKPTQSYGAQALGAKSERF